MHKRHSKSEFLALLAFLVVLTLIVSNGFVARIFAQGKDVDVYSSIEPIGNVLNTVLDEYVRDPDINKVVEGALVGMMNSLDPHSSYIPAEFLRKMKEDTKGEFQGIGVKIQLDDQKNIVVFQPLPDSPAARAGILAGDILIKIDGVSTAGISLDEASKRIRGPEGSIVVVTVLRSHDDGRTEEFELNVKRESIPLESIKEARILSNGTGYIRISDFKENTASDLERDIKKLLKEGMTSLILDLRWNTGGLLTASKEVCELFLPKNTLVVYTKGREGRKSTLSEDLNLYTEKEPVMPEGTPLVVLVNEDTASSSEIVTGALQFWQRAIIVGERTFGKGSVQTIIPLPKPAGSALRLTTALYYTPADVTIDSEGILPDVPEPMTRDQQRNLWKQMTASYEKDANKINEQNHGSVTGNEATAETVEDTQLKKAVAIIAEDPVFSNLIAKYHKDVHETQVAAPVEKLLQGGRNVNLDESEAALPEGETQDKTEPAPAPQDQPPAPAPSEPPKE